MVFTFKTEQPTGKRRSFDSPIYNIKFKGQEIGTIDASPPHKVRFQVIKKNIADDGNLNCSWKWVVWNNGFKDISEAKDWIKRNEEKLLNYFNNRYVGLNLKLNEVKPNSSHD